MSVRCGICGKKFVIGDRFYHAEPVTLTDDGVVGRHEADEDDYVCLDCLDVDLTPIDEPRKR